jgi:hypothetical protein
VWAELREAGATAARLDVSPIAIGWRLFNLGLVDHKPV